MVINKQDFASLLDTAMDVVAKVTKADSEPVVLTNIEKFAFVSYVAFIGNLMDASDVETITNAADKTLNDINSKVNKSLN